MHGDRTMQGVPCRVIVLCRAYHDGRKRLEKRCVYVGCTRSKAFRVVSPAALEVEPERQTCDPFDPIVDQAKLVFDLWEREQLACGASG